MRSICVAGTTVFVFQTPMRHVKIKWLQSDVFQFFKVGYITMAGENRKRKGRLSADKSYFV
jgi:hypothetical protein